MDIEQLRAYCLSKKAVTEEFPFDQDTLVFKVLGKMYALISLSKWEKGERAINLKCAPEIAIELRAAYESVSPGFHMNKKHWNTIALTSREISDAVLKEWIDHSYELVIKGMNKKMKAELDKF
jgi:predicted DNA-binding protein (MmcQ/YjbR family)